MSRMPGDSNWNTPLVKPLEKISNVAVSSSGRSSSTIRTPCRFSISFSGVVDQREGGQPEEVHLEQAELLETAHVVLGDDFLPVRAVERHQFLAAAAAR